MARALRAAFGPAAGSLLLLGAGCTWLISFDDAPPTDGGAPVEASTPSPRPEAGAADSTPTPTPTPDAADDARRIPTMPACDPNFPLDEVEGCESFVERAQICADSAGLTAYPGDRATDVVTCSKTKGATCVRHCVACAHLPEGYPDQCDQCIGRTDGTYCGTDMGWQPENFRLLVTCEAGLMKEAKACSARGCDSKGGAGEAACKP